MPGNVPNQVGARFFLNNINLKKLRKFFSILFYAKEYVTLYTPQVRSEQ